MKVRRVSFVGTRTAAFDATVEFFQDVLGLPPVFAHPGWAGFSLGGRDLVEVFEDARRHEPFFPSVEHAGCMVAFAVDDLAAAREELAAAGAELIGELFWADEAAGSGWCFFRAPDGNVYALQQTVAPEAS